MSGNPFLQAMGNESKKAETPETEATTENVSDNPLLSLSAPVPEPEEEPAEPEIQLPSGAPTLEELASQDTSEILAIQTRAETILQKTEKYICAEAEDVRGLLDMVDVAMKENDTLNGFDLSTIRNHVATIMVTLKAKPEFSTILLDEDVGNMVRFARETYEAAQVGVTISAEKQKKRTAKKGKKAQLDSKSAAAMSAAFDNLLGKGGLL